CSEDLIKCIDMGVYKSINNMRIMGSPKYDKNGKNAGKFVLREEYEEFDPSTLIMPVDPEVQLFKCSTSMCHVLASGKKPKKYVDIANGDMDSVRKIIEEKYPQFEIKGAYNNIIKLKDSHTKPCPVHDYVHQNENPYVRIREDKSSVLVCRRDDKYIVIMNSPVA